MSHLRRFYGSLSVLSLLVPLLILTATPAAAQDGRVPPITVFVLSNVMTNAERAGGPDEEWRVQVSIQPLSGCVPTRGDGVNDTYRIDAGNEAGAGLSLEECVFSIAATVRDDSLESNCSYPAELAWGQDPRTGDYVDDSVLTLSRPPGEARLSIRRKPGSPCGAPNRTQFAIRAGDVVEALPDGSADPALLALALRAVVLTEFGVRVVPDDSTGTVASPGCHRVTSLDVRGDGDRVVSSVHDVVGTGSCPLKAVIVDAPAPFEAPEDDAVLFDAGGFNILVDLSRLVRLRPARIAIIQDVDGSLNRGAVSYALTRTCGDVSVGPSDPGGTVSPLYEGRYTVHAPHAAAFGPTATYAIGAASSTSTEVVGCSVTVTVSGVPAGCSVAGGLTRTLTWSAANPIENFDFEFDISCGTGEAGPTTEAGPPPAGTTGDPDTTGEGSVAVTASADVRLVARQLSSGKIEFGLQQRQDQGAWSGHRLPGKRLFPADAQLGRWLVSSPLTVHVAGTPDALAEEFEVRIVARRTSDGRVEFGLQERSTSGSWGGAELPTRRFFPAAAPVGRWLASSVIDLNG